MDPEGQYAALKSAILGATSASSPVGNIPELAKYYALPGAVGPTRLANAGGNFNTGVADSNNKAAAAEAKANQIDELKAQAQAAQDANDPNKFQQVAKKDGGYAFYDGAGKEISAFQYARATGKDPAQVLSKSQNPIDIGFTKDYKQLQDYLNAKANSKNDAGAAETAKNIEDIVKKQYGIDLHKMKISDVIQRFQQAYPTVFGGTNRGIPAGQTFIPGKNAIPVGASGGSIGH